MFFIKVINIKYSELCCHQYTVSICWININTEY